MCYVDNMPNGEQRKKAIFHAVGASFMYYVCWNNSRTCNTTYMYCVQNKPNTWLALGRRRPIIFFFRSSSFVVVKALSLTSMFRLESSVSKKSCLRCTILLRRFSSVGVVNKRKPPTTTFPSTSSISCFHCTLIDYLVVFNASKRVFCCL